MTLLVIAVLLSSLSFFAYVAHYFTSPHMKDEFKRFGIEKLGRVIIVGIGPAHAIGLDRKKEVKGQPVGLVTGLVLFRLE